MKILRILLIALFVLLSATQAYAQDSEAEKLYQEGAEAYFQGDYAQAIIKFKQGNDLDPNPMFLYNLSLAYAKLGNVEEAESHSRRADAAGLPENFADKNKARLASFRLQMKAVEVAESDPEPIEDGVCERNEDCSGGEVCNLEQNQCVVVNVASENGGGLSVVGWAGVGVAGAGVLALGAAMVIDLGLSSDIDAYNAAVSAGELTTAESLKSDIESSQSLGRVLLFSGLGLAAVGAGLLVYDLMVVDEAGQTAWYPMIGPDQAGIGYLRRF